MGGGGGGEGCDSEAIDIFYFLNNTCKYFS